MEALRTKQEVVSARYTAAEAQVRVNEALAGVSTNLNDFGSELKEAETRTDHLRARADAIDELMRSGSLGRGMPAGDLIADMMLDPREAEAVERELDAFKRAVGDEPRP